MDAALFTKMLSDKNVLDLRKLGYKFPQADIKEFTELLKNGFYHSLPLKDFSGQNIVYLSSIAQVRLSAAKVLLTPQNSTQLYGVKAMEEEIVSTFTIEQQVDFTRDSVRKILSGLAPTDESESRIFGMKKPCQRFSCIVDCSQCLKRRLRCPSSGISHLPKRRYNSFLYFLWFVQSRSGIIQINHFVSPPILADIYFCFFTFGVYYFSDNRHFCFHLCFIKFFQNRIFFFFRNCRQQTAGSLRVTEQIYIHLIGISRFKKLCDMISVAICSPGNKSHLRIFLCPFNIGDIFWPKLYLRSARRSHFPAMSEKPEPGNVCTCMDRKLVQYFPCLFV